MRARGKQAAGSCAAPPLISHTVTRPLPLRYHAPPTRDCSPAARFISQPAHASFRSRFMDRREFLAVLPATAIASQLLAAKEPGKIAVGANDWPWWRGATRDGIAAEQKVPLE